jgi:hypothetical protein
VKASAAGNFVLRTPAAGTVITCTGTSLAAGAKILGSTGANAGTSNEVILYSGCTVTGNGENCEVESGKINTNTVKNTLGWSTAGRGGPLLVLFEPTSGTNFVTVKFTGSSCILKTSPVSGKAVGEAGGTGENTVNTLTFTTPKKTIWTESSGTLTETKAELKAFTIDASTIEGVANLELAGKPKWSVLP